MRELNNISDTFTREQVDFICKRIGDWYLKYKDDLSQCRCDDKTHRLGYLKEILKEMICPGYPEKKIKMNNKLEVGKKYHYRNISYRDVICTVVYRDEWNVVYRFNDEKYKQHLITDNIAYFNERFEEIQDEHP